MTVYRGRAQNQGLVVAWPRLVAAVALASVLFVTLYGAAWASAAASPHVSATWTSQSISGSAGPVNSVSCPTTSHCVAVDNQSSLVTTDGGASWAVHSTPVGQYNSLTGVSCASSASCVAVTGAFSAPGLALTSADGGVTWNSQSVPDNAKNLHAVSCSSSSQCVGVGGAGPGEVATTSDGGATWTSRSLPNGTNGLAAVSCPTTSFCLAMGGQNGGSISAAAIVATSDGGATWTSEPAPGAAGSLTGVSCATTARCR
jgi:hypothetical protein